MQYSIQDDTKLTLTKYLLNLNFKPIQEQLARSLKGEIPRFVSAAVSLENLKLLLDHGLNISSCAGLLHYASLLQYQTLLKLGVDPKIEKGEDSSP